MNEEDQDKELDISAAASFRQMLHKQAQTTSDPLHQALLDLELLGEPFGISDLADYDSDTSDIDDTW